jgi:hypothetical protein
VRMGACGLSLRFPGHSRQQRWAPPPGGTGAVLPDVSLARPRASVVSSEQVRAIFLVY